MNIGNKIYELRNSKNMSQGDLSDYLDVSRQSVSKWENGTAVPDLDKLIKICDLFEISLDELTGRDTDSEPKNSIKPEDVVYKNSALTQQKIFGYILLVISFVVGPLCLLINPLIGVYIIVVALVCSINCFIQRHHVFYFSFGSAMCVLSTMPYVSDAPMHPLSFQLAFAGLLLIFTFIAWRDSTAPVSKGYALGVVIGWIVFLALIVFLCLQFTNLANIFTRLELLLITMVPFNVIEMPLYVATARWFFSTRKKQVDN